MSSCLSPFCPHILLDKSGLLVCQRYGGRGKTPEPGVLGKGGCKREEATS